MPKMSPRTGVFLVFLAAGMAVPATVMAQAQAAGVVAVTRAQEYGYSLLSCG